MGLQISRGLHSQVPQEDAVRGAAEASCGGVPEIGDTEECRARSTWPGSTANGSVGQHFWARGYYVSTVGRDEQAIREYIKNQEEEDRRLEQLNLWR